jgi:hypothetical protein
MSDAQNLVPTPEELAAEQAGLKAVQEDEIRAEIIADLGFDEEADAELIDKLVAREVGHRKKLSSAIGQKVKIRAERDEFRAKAEPPKKEPAMQEKQSEGFSLKDSRALANVHDDDIDFVVNFANINKISISGAVKNDDVQVILKDHQEKRETAAATNTGGGRRGVSEVPDEVLIDKIKKGELDIDDMPKVARAIMEQRRKAVREQS